MQLSTLQTTNKRFTIAAFDHRASLAEKLGINVDTQQGVAQFIQLKQLFMEVFSPINSAVLTDPEFGKFTVQYKDARAGLLLSIEESGYEGGKEIVPPLLPNWGVQGIAGYDAAVKLLLYFHPDEKNASGKLDLVQRIAEESAVHTLPFLLEPVLYAVEDEATFLTHWRSLQQRTVSAFDPWCDVHKIEYPGVHEKSAEAQHSACLAITQIATKPWIILSRGMEFSQFHEALHTSIEAGGSGFAVGRGVWQEIEQYSIEKTGSWDVSFGKMSEFLHTTALERMQKLIDVVV